MSDLAGAIPGRFHQQGGAKLSSETYPMPAEESLVLEAGRGDTSAFAELYEAYFDKIYRYVLLRTGNRADAEDLAAEVFLKALEAIGTFKQRGAPFASWLFRIAHNLVVDQLRRGARRKTAVLEDDLPIATPPPDEQVVLELTMADVLRAMTHVTDGQRQVISLRFAAGLSIAETAHAMGRKDGAVKALQHSAIEAVRRHMRRDGYEAVL